MRWAHRRRPFVSRRLEALTGRTREAPAPTLAVLVYRGVSTAEIDLPVSVLADRLGASVQFVGTEPGVLPGVEPSRDVVVDVLAADAALPDWLVVPGGLGWRRVIDDRPTMAWLAMAGAQARAVSSPFRQAACFWPRPACSTVSMRRAIGSPSTTWSVSARTPFVSGSPMPGAS